MTDIIDQAQRTEELHLQAALKARHAATNGKHEARECTDCGAEIPAKRVATVDAVRCVDCQSALERKQKQYTRG